MKKKMVSMFLAIVLFVTNASMIHALSPVAEIYYNIGSSTYNSSNFESELNDAIKAKLLTGGVNPKYMGIMDASADSATVTDTTYVHNGRDSWYMGYTPEVETPDFNHVQLTNNGRTATFYGYTHRAYKDFMLTDGSPTGKKIITFDMDESKVNYHSMEGGGFLFNSKIDSDGDLYGYAILFVDGGVKVYKINGVNADSLHNEQSKYFANMTGVSSIGSFSKGASTHHSIKIIATDTQLNMWDNGVHSIVNLTLPDVYGDEFGPIVTHGSHACEIISIFTFDNMKLYTTSDKTLDVAVEDIEWGNSPLRYVVNINDVHDGYLDGGPSQASLTNQFNTSGVQYIGVTDATYQSISTGFIGGLTNGGLYVDSNTTPSSDLIDAIATRIADQIITQYKAAIEVIEDAEDNTNVTYTGSETKNGVKNDLTLVQDEHATTVWSSDQPSIISTDGTVTRPIMESTGTYVTLTATITHGGLTSEKTFTVYVLAAEPGPVTTLSATGGKKQATLNFPALVGATSGDIVIEQSTNGTTFTAATISGTLDATSTSATVTGLKNGTNYYFRITVGAGHYSGVSNVAAAMTDKAPAPVDTPTLTPKVTVSDKSNGGTVVEDKITALVGGNLEVSGSILSASGEVLDLPSIAMNEDGVFIIPQVPPGEYTLALNIIGPNGENLAGPAGKLTVDKDGNANLEVELVDPYGTILDTVTGQPVVGVDMRLYWSDTELNRAHGRTPDTLVNLPILPDFPPNQNHNPQISSDTGEYGWMVYADGDYYFIGEKDGYVVFDSRKDEREEMFGTDSYIRNGIIHVGQTIVKFSFSTQPKLKDAGDHKPYMSGYPDGSFLPENGITRAELAAILSRLYTPAGIADKLSFVDVNATHWAVHAIENASKQLWMIGYDNHIFSPQKQVTRAEFAQTLLNVYDWNVVKETKYTDVKGHWAEGAIATLEEKGFLFDFTADSFAPNQAITRIEAIRVFNRLLARHPWHIDVEPRWTDVLEDNEDYTDIMESSIPHPFEQYETGIEAWK